MGKYNGHYFKQISYQRLSFDIFAASLALALAFFSRAIFELLNNSNLDQVHTEITLYADFFVKLLPQFVGLTVLVFFLLGYYSQKKKFNKTYQQHVFYLFSSLLPSLFLLVAIYLQAPEPKFPRGVFLSLMFFSWAFFFLPRLFKSYLVAQSQFEGVVESSKDKGVRNILVIGGAGYIGSKLCEDLLGRGYKVRVLDSLMFGQTSLVDIKSDPKFELVVGDFRNVQTVVSASKGMDAVVHLAGIVGDPACSIDDNFTIDVNLTATTMIAEVCKLHGIERMLFASSCSVYGQSDSFSPLTEESDLKPVSLYAKTKIASEKVLQGMTTENFQPTILRFATLFGYSKRPRFDLAVNVLTALAVIRGKISVFGGDQWRPFVHVNDVSRSIIALIESPLEVIGGEIFNVGSNKENLKIIEVSEIIKEQLPQTEVVVDGSKEDNRNYFVKFDKLNEIIDTDSFMSVEEGVLEIVELIKKGVISDPFTPEYSNLKVTERLLEEHIRSPRVSFYKKSPQDLLKQIH
jgi:nucleoside-diphosphate-sugar epimerase